MDLTVGTFNLNNLFSRFNLYTEVAPATRGVTSRESAPAPRPWLHTRADTARAAAEAASDEIVVVNRGHVAADGRLEWRREYRGRLIFGKDPEAQATLARRLKALKADVIGLQEVENIEALEDFVRAFGLRDAGFRHLALIEGNDDRFIDVALMSKLPLGAVTSWRHRRHPEASRSAVFSRDLLQVEILDPTRERVLLTVFVNHLKSQLGDKATSDTRRRRQAESVCAVLAERPPANPFVVLGDMNDVPDAPCLAGLAGAQLVNGLAHAIERGGPYPPDDPSPPPVGKPWTHRFRSRGETRYDLYDQIWLSPDLRDHLVDAWILRRTTRGGDASDHDPAAVRLTGL